MVHLQYEKGNVFTSSGDLFVFKCGILPTFENAPVSGTLPGICTNGRR